MAIVPVADATKRIWNAITCARFGHFGNVYQFMAVLNQNLRLSFTSPGGSRLRGRRARMDVDEGPLDSHEVAS
jgi:hypothetical protein